MNTHSGHSVQWVRWLAESAPDDTTSNPATSATLFVVSAHGAASDWRVLGLLLPALPLPPSPRSFPAQPSALSGSGHAWWTLCLLTWPIRAAKQNKTTKTEKNLKMFSHSLRAFFQLLLSSARLQIENEKKTKKNPSGILQWLVLPFSDSLHPGELRLRLSGLLYSPSAKLIAYACLLSHCNFA